MNTNFFLHLFIRAGLDRESLLKVAENNNLEKTWKELPSDKKAAIDEGTEAKLLEKEKITLLSIHDTGYPELLKHIYLPPPLLYVRGTLIADEPKVAVVGTRKASPYGLEVTKTLVSKLSPMLTIVSGLAYGIDTEAHKAALGAGGKTIAVLGSGIDQKSIFPQINVQLAEEIIAKGGALISEYPPGAPGLSHHFPERNRIISGLSLGTIITEAPIKSGAMITARLALEQNREVFAMPGPVFNPRSEGPLRLIQQGAHLILSGEDVFEILGLAKPEMEVKKFANLNANELKLISLVKESPKKLDEIIQILNIPTHEALTLVTMLEIKGVLKDIGQKTYRVL